MGCSRQGYWSGLPFPLPRDLLHPGIKPESLALQVILYLLSHRVLCLVSRSCPTLCNPIDCSLPGSSVHGDSPGKNTGMGCHAIHADPGIKPRSPALKVDSLLPEPPGKPTLTAQSMKTGPLAQVNRMFLNHHMVYFLIHSISGGDKFSRVKVSLCIAPRVLAYLVKEPTGNSY